MEAESANAQGLERAVKLILANYDDPDREGLKDTPRRYVKFLDEFFDVGEFQMTTFDAEGMDEMIIETDIPFHSLCEHHLAPFFGTASIGYIPKDKIVGLSKLPRVLDMFSRRFQNQERITKQVAEYLNNELDAVGVAVILKAQHLCMTMRGIKKPGVWTITSFMMGSFRDHPETRNEFLRLIK